MFFENQDSPVSLADIQSVEAELGMRFPESLKTLFLENNGGTSGSICVAHARPLHHRQ